MGQELLHRHLSRMVQRMVRTEVCIPSVRAQRVELNVFELQHVLELLHLHVVAHHKANLCFAVLHALDHLLQTVFHQLERHAVIVVIVVELRHQTPHCDDWIGGNRQHRRVLFLRQALNELHLVDDRARVLVELFALVSQHDALVRAVENTHLELVFQIADGLAQIGLRDEQLLRGLVDTALLRNGDKVGKLLNLHNSFPLLHVVSSV